MINDIREINFPRIDGKQYATLSQATVTLVDMGEKTITAQLKVDGRITPDFSYDWEVEFQGERYIMPLRKPQGSKGCDSLNSVVDLTFHHWAIYQLKRHLFFDTYRLNTEVYAPDKYIASVNLDLPNFKDLLARVLKYYFGDKIQVRLNREWADKNVTDPIFVEINHSYIWDVVAKIYDLYGARWRIVKEGESYIIDIGTTEPEINHIFQYGFDGGLTKVERQVQDENIRNILFGRGGTKNMPLRYFKAVDPQNPGFAADPDWIPELANASLTELHGATFRSYVQGWNHRHYKRTAVTSANMAYAPWAWLRGYNDKLFNPVEFVADKYEDAGKGYDVAPRSSIASYGELEGGIENNEDIFPSIQGREVPGLGRIDEAVDVEQVSDAGVADAATNDAMTINIEPVNGGTATVEVSEWPSTVKITLPGNSFIINEGKTGNLYVDTVDVICHSLIAGGRLAITADNYELQSYTVKVTNSLGAAMPSPIGLPAGAYSYSVEVAVRIKLSNTSKQTQITCTASHNGARLESATPGSAGNNLTFDVWIKNIWESVRRSGETDAQYVDRVWSPILGDREGNEAKVVFATGMLAISEDYEFTIVSGGVHYDDSRSLNGVPSHWRLTLMRSDADYESTGVYVPGEHRQGRPGDKFFFTGIDLPHQYVLLAERALDNYKKDELAKVKDIVPQWVVEIDPVRAFLPSDPLFDKLTPGAPIRLADKRFIGNGGQDAAYETLYLKSVTFDYIEPTDKEANLLPNISVVLSDSYATAASPVATLQSSVDSLQRQVGAIGNLEQLVRAVGDKLYLRKDGLFDRSVSPTEFANLLTSYQFRQGMIGGRGWGFYRDANGNWVLETDILKARQTFEVNNLIVNQISARGGMIIESAAALEISSVEKRKNGDYVCFFDTKSGSVKNLFMVNDVALCHRFDPKSETSPATPGDASNAYEKFYKRCVLEVGEDYVVLSEGHYVNGSGIPTAGDVIVQYGHYSNKNRQFVIVRDVTGGGYERFIEGLTSVDSTGEEYFFVGRQAGMYGNRARFFIGDTEQYIEYKYDEHLKKNKLSVKADLDIESTIADMSMEEYIRQNTKDGIENHALGTLQPAISVPMTGKANESTTLFNITGLAIGDTVRVSFDYSVKDVFDLNQANQRVVFMLDRAYGYKSLLTLTANGSGHFESEPFVLGEGASQDFIAETTPDTVCPLYVRTDYCRGGEISLSNLMVVKGEILPKEWRPSPRDYDAVAKAMTGNTQISGGMVLSSMIQVGSWEYNWTDNWKRFAVTAGMNGVVNPNHTHGGAVFWGGGTYAQAEAGKSTYVIYTDGTGHAAGGTIKFQENNLQVGDYVNLNKNGLDMEINGSRRMQLGNYNVDGKYIMQYQLVRNLGFLDLTVEGKATVATGEGRFYCKWKDGVSPKCLDKHSVSIGDIPAGSRVKCSSSQTISFPFDTQPGEVQYIGATRLYLHVYLHKSGETPWLDGSDCYFYKDLEPELKHYSDHDYMEFSLVDLLDWVAPKDCDAVVFTIVAVAGNSYNTHLGTFEYSLGTNSPVMFEATMPQYNQTVLGVNGFQASWGNSNQFQNNDFWGVRVNNSGIKVTPEGVYVRGKTGDWHLIS